MGEIRALTAIAAIAALLGTLLFAGTANATHDVEVQDSKASRSRIYTAYTNDRGTIFEVTFRTTSPGEKRRIRARVEAVMPSSASDPMLVIRHAIRCAPVGTTAYREELFGARNVLRGQTLVQTPRYVFTAGEPGDYHCWLWLSSGRPRPSSIRETSNVYRIGWGSYLHATVPVHPQSGQHFTPAKPSHLLHRGQASDENVLSWTAPAGTSKFSASGDAYLTTCTSVGGSMDPVTGKQLCTGYTKTYGSKVITRLIVGQVAAGGSGYCALHYFPSAKGRDTYITKDIHHVVVFNSGSVPVRTTPDCSRSFRVKVSVKVYDGATIMVHRQGTITSAVPSG